MPVEAKPLFRPDVLRPHLLEFAWPKNLTETKAALARWADLFSTGRADKFTEQELLPDFLKDVFCDALGYTRLADNAARFTTFALLECGDSSPLSFLTWSTHFRQPRGRLHRFMVPAHTRKQSGDESPQSKMDSDALVAEVKKLRGKSKPLTAAGLKALREEDAHTLAPVRVLATEALTLERQLSDLVNTAYGLTPAEVQLMWDTAPPRMPIAPPTECV